MINLRHISKSIFAANNGNRQWLKILRLSAALMLIAKTLSEWSSLELLYGSQGFIPSDIAAFSQHPLLPSVLGLYSHLQPCLSESAYLQLYFGIVMIGAAMLAIGYCSRAAAIACWILTVITCNSSHLTSYGFDAVLTMMLFYCAIFPVGTVYVRSEQQDLSPIYLKMLQVHVCLIYFVNAVCKINGPAWHDGSGLWDMVHQPQFASLLTPLLIRVLSLPHIASVSGMAVIILELLFPFLIWVRPLQRIALLLIIALHLIIAMVMGLWLFALTMILLDIAAFGVVLHRD